MLKIIRYIKHKIDSRRNWVMKMDKRKLGACKGAFEVPDDIDESNDEIAEMFYNSTDGNFLPCKKQEEEKEYNDDVKK